MLCQSFKAYVELLPVLHITRRLTIENKSKKTVGLYDHGTHFELKKKIGLNGHLGQ